jgi:hypothetical protein
MNDARGRRLFTAAAILLLLIGAMHSLSFLETPTPANDTEKQLLARVWLRCIGFRAAEGARRTPQARGARQRVVACDHDDRVVTLFLCRTHILARHLIVGVHSGLEEIAFSHLINGDSLANWCFPQHLSPET